MKAAEDVNRIAAEFLVGYLNDEDHYRPDDRLFRTLARTTALVDALFSTEAASCIEGNGGDDRTALGAVRARKYRELRTG